jgi:GNAT superfamily N-acetyltransferase
VTPQPEAAPGLEVVELATADTYDLRRRVLRDGTPSRDVTYAQDDLPGTVHLGGRLGGELVAVSSWAREALPGEPGTPAVRLRGMAVDQRLQGAGAGRRLLDAGVERARRDGAAIVWATARDAVLGFYAGAGFEARGDGFVDEATGLPHHVIVLRLI